VDALIGACAVTALIFASPLLLDIYANRSPRGRRVSPLPPAFSWVSTWPLRWVRRDHARRELWALRAAVFRDRRGVSPDRLSARLRRTHKARIFEAGLPVAIARRFGTNKPNGHLQFVAFFPLTQRDMQAGSPEVETSWRGWTRHRRHQIDPSPHLFDRLVDRRSGVWNLAEAIRQMGGRCPGCPHQSRVEKVKHLPRWIFHGARDQEALVNGKRIPGATAQGSRAMYGTRSSPTVARDLAGDV